MTFFYLEKTLAKPGDSISIFNDCTGGNRVFESDNQSVGVTYVDGDWKVHAVGVGEAKISETTSFCDDRTPVIMTVAQDGQSPFMPLQDYKDYQGLEVVVTCVIIVMAFLFNNWKR